MTTPPRGTTFLVTNYLRKSMLTSLSISIKMPCPSAAATVARLIAGPVSAALNSAHVMNGLHTCDYRKVRRNS